jgi:hypothetical protein
MVLVRIGSGAYGAVDGYQHARHARLYGHIHAGCHSASAPRTVDFHRANLLKTLGARNAAHLVNKVLGE